MTGEVRRGALWVGLCLFGAMAALEYVVGGLASPHPLTQRDFTNLWMAGHLALHGDLAVIFQPDLFHAATKSLLGADFANNYSYPPHALFVAMPFGAMPYGWALAAWDAVSLAAFYFAARPLIPPSLPRWAAILNPAALICLVFGHYGLLAGALFIWAFRGSGLSAAVLTIKPHIGLLVAVRMLRDRKALLVAVAGTVLLVGLSVLAFGLDPWKSFLDTTFHYQSGLLDGQRAGLRKRMVTPFLYYGLAGQVIFAGLAVWLLTRRFNVFTAATATFLILPYGFHYDMTVASLGCAVMLAANWDSLPLPAKGVLGAGYLAPALTMIGAWIVPPIMLACLYVQVSHHARGNVAVGTVSPLSDA